MHELAAGRGATDVTDAARVAKSRSRVRTFPTDITDRLEMAERVTALAVDLTHEVVAEGREVRKVGVTVRTSTFHTATKNRTLPAPTADPGEVARAACDVLDRFELHRPVRLLGVLLGLDEQLDR